VASGLYPQQPASQGDRARQRGWLEVAKISGGTAGIGSMGGGEDERADMWGPHVSDRNERRHKLRRETYSDGGAKGVQAYRAGWVRRWPEWGSGMTRASWSGSKGSFQNGN
jgi:hypothetical protein